MRGMSDANCPYCGGQISQSRISCESCGRLFPLAIVKTWLAINLRLLMWGAIVTGAVFAVICVLNLFGIHLRAE